MSAHDVLDVSRDAFTVLLITAGPLMLVSMVIGVVISVVQALTSIQEMTLTFVPKLVAMLVAGVLLLPFMLTTLMDFTRTLFARIVEIG